MLHLLDTNVCVDYLTGRHPEVVARLQSAAPEELCVSAVVAAELRYGADRSAHPRRNHARIDALLAEIRCAPFDAAASRLFGRVRRRLESAGTPIGPYDTMIAAHALQLGAVLITDNVREFERVAGLVVRNWRAAGG